MFWDTAGLEKYRSLIEKYYNNTAGIILVYSVNDRKSFTNVDMWMKQIKAKAGDDVTIILVANKCDVSDRQVETAEGQELADQYGIKFFETSAKSEIRVNEPFNGIVRQTNNKFTEQNGTTEKPTPATQLTTTEEQERQIPGTDTTNEQNRGEKKC